MDRTEANCLSVVQCSSMKHQKKREQVRFISWKICKILVGRYGYNALYLVLPEVCKYKIETSMLM